VSKKADRWRRIALEAVPILAAEKVCGHEQGVEACVSGLCRLQAAIVATWKAEARQ
jgi:hypothetical protein